MNFLLIQLSGSPACWRDFASLTSIRCLKDMMGFLLGGAEAGLAGQSEAGRLVLIIGAVCCKVFWEVTGGGVVGRSDGTAFRVDIVAVPG